MAKRKAPARTSSAEVDPVKGRPTKAQTAKAALTAKQTDLLDLLTEKAQATRTRAKKAKPGSEG